jgi:D-Tyr-tRNAtyr deacylase
MLCPLAYRSHRIFEKVGPHFLSLAREHDVKVEAGEFGATMEVELVSIQAIASSDGPVTIILDSRRDLKRNVAKEKVRNGEL